MNSAITAREADVPFDLLDGWEKVHMKSGSMDCGGIRKNTQGDFTDTETKLEKSRHYFIIL